MIYVIKALTLLTANDDCYGRKMKEEDFFV